MKFCIQRVRYGQAKQDKIGVLRLVDYVQDEKGTIAGRSGAEGGVGVAVSTVLHIRSSDSLSVAICGVDLSPLIFSDSLQIRVDIFSMC